LDSLDNKTLKWKEKNKETKKNEHKQREKEEIQIRTYEKRERNMTKNSNISALGILGICKNPRICKRCHQKYNQAQKLIMVYETTNTLSGYLKLEKSGMP
jgi:membrane-associated protease RseP (regulator of RpoE activity)